MDLLNQLINFVLAFEEDRPENDLSELQKFRLALMLIHDSDVGYLYSTSVFNEKFTLSDIILEFTDYNLSNQFIKTEILWLAEYERFDCIRKILNDGYFPNLEDIIEVNNFFRENNFHLSASDLFQNLNHIQSVRHLERIVNNMRNRT